MFALLMDRGLFDLNELRNTLMLPVDQELANKMRISVYSDNPSLAYTNGISDQLERFWNSTEAWPQERAIVPPLRILRKRYIGSQLR